MRINRPFYVFAIQILLSIILVVLLTWILLLLRTFLSTQIIALLFLLPVLISAGYLSITGGITASFASFLAFNYFFIPPYHTLAVHQSQDILALIVFLLVAVIISQSLAQAKVGMETAVARERETTVLYELNIALAGLIEPEEIMKVVGGKIVEHFPVDYVALDLKLPSGKQINYELPEKSSKSRRKEDINFNIASGTDSSGLVRIWLKNQIDQPQQRLLRAFASQTTLVLEKAFLEDAERRASLLEESDKLKSTLLSSVSHELRTPLSTIKASISSLRSGEIEWESEARKELLTAVEEESDHLNQLVGNLLDMSRIEMGELKPAQKNYSLKEILMGVVRRMRHQISGHTLIIDIPENLPLVFVDYSQMEQVFGNLLSNSAKYAPEGTEIHVIAESMGNGLVKVQVVNQGPPVKSEYLTRIFDKFFRVTDADQVTGTGLGLSICKGIIEGHSGNIWAENRPEGVAFIFTIPVSSKQINPIETETGN